MQPPQGSNPQGGYQSGPGVGPSPWEQPPMLNQWVQRPVPGQQVGNGQMPGAPPPPAQIAPDPSMQPDYYSAGGQPMPGAGYGAAPQPAAPAQPRPVQNVDDLFADTPPPAAKAPAAAAAPTAATAEAESSFTPNEQTKRMLKRINDRRSYFDRKLREGNVIFFGTRYSPVSLDSRLVRSLLTVLPEALRDANDGAQLYATLRAKGTTYISREVCDDLVENRQDYLQIIERRKEMEKNDELQSFLD